MRRFFIILFVLILGIGGIVLTVSGFNGLINERQLAETQIYELKAKIATMDRLNEIRQQNNTAIFLEDQHGFINRGVVSLGNQAEVIKAIKVTDENGAESILYRYQLNGAVGLVDEATGDWIRIDAVEGETIHLFTHSYGDGPKYISYYTCYTNSSHCASRSVETLILAE